MKRVRDMSQQEREALRSVIIGMPLTQKLELLEELLDSMSDAEKLLTYRLCSNEITLDQWVDLMNAGRGWKQ